MVLLLGQYSVGKTSFIRSLLQRDFPGQRVGPEPTTDRFMAVMYGNEERLVPGHALAMQVIGLTRMVGWYCGNCPKDAHGTHCRSNHHIITPG